MKIMSTLMFVSLAVLMTACGSDEDSTQTPAIAPVGEVEREAVVTDDVAEAGDLKATDTMADMVDSGDADDDLNETHEAHMDHDDHNHASHTGRATGASGSLSAHVHGKGELVVVKTEDGFQANFIAPLASLGLDSSLADTDKLPTTITNDWLVAPDAAGCSADTDQTILAIDRLGDHGDLDMDFTFVCDAPEAVNFVDLALFGVTSALETVDGIFIADGDQHSQSLTKQSSRLKLSH